MEPPSARLVALSPRFCCCRGVLLWGLQYLDTKEFEQGFYADRTPARGEAGWSRVTQLTGEFQGSHLWGVIAKHSSADNAGAELSGYRFGCRRISEF